MSHTLMNYLGIDPGINGGVALLRPDGQVILAQRMPFPLTGELQMFQRLVGYGVTFAVLELVRTSPQMGVKSAGTFMRGVGRLEAFLTASGIRYAEVAPAKWQKAMHCRTGGNKNVTLAAAKKLFPTLAINHTIADALLIAEYARRIHLPTRRKRQP